MNAGSRFHNQILYKKVEELKKNQTTKASTIVILDLYYAFLSAIQQQKHLEQGNWSSHILLLLFVNF